MDSFAENIEGVRQLVQSGTNKTRLGNSNPEEGVVGEYEDILELKMSDDELLALRNQWENSYAPYYSPIKTKQEINKKYYLGIQRQNADSQGFPVPSNLIFESEETFIPQALSKNPEPVVWSDNTNEGKEASNKVKTMLQYHADILCLRKKLGVMVRHWSVYYLGVVKHGWDKRSNDISCELRRPTNFILDPNGYVDEFGTFRGKYLGERIMSTAEELIDLFPGKKEYITLKVDGKLGTEVVRTEWWTDDYCFTTYQDVVLEKHKNEFFNYDKTEKVEIDGIEESEEVKGHNHFAYPKMPYTFLSVFSFQEKPHDVTNLIEQNISNQDRINDRDYQIDKNLKNGNNSIAFSGDNFNVEEAKQGAQALENGDPVIVPSGKSIHEAIVRIPASNIPSAVFQAQQNDKETLRSVFGVQGLSAQAPNENTTARGMILNQNHDSTRIGGGIGDALEQVADNIFNWWLQLYYVFYDEPHYAAIMGSGQAVEYVKLVMNTEERRFVVSVSPNSMQPKDEITEQNLAIDLANKGWLDPINLFKKLNYPDPMETAKMVVMFKLDPMMYMQKFFPEEIPNQGNMQENPPDLNQPPVPQDESLSANPASASLSQVPIDMGESMPQ